jgi:hypothetical protein
MEHHQSGVSASRPRSGPEDLERHGVHSDNHGSSVSDPRVSPENNADEEEDTDRGKARQRNEERMRQLNQGDIEVLGEYLPEAVGSVFDTAVQGPLDAAVKADGSLLRAIECALRKETPVPRKPPFQFDMTPKARGHNTKILEECGYDLEKVIQPNTGSTIYHGSEFRDEETLRAILGNLPYYNDFKPFLSQGVDFVFTEEITKEVRVEELEEANLERGNHKSAQGQKENAIQTTSKGCETWICGTALQRGCPKHTWGYGPAMRDNLPAVHAVARRKPRCQKEADPQHELWDEPRQGIGK